MEFETALQQACYEKIVPWMQEFFVDFLVVSEEEPLFVVNFGSAIAYTEVIPWENDEAVILTRAYVVTNVEVTSELMQYLLQENDGLYFGRFALDQDGNIAFEHTLVGSTCDPEELRLSVISVVKFADDYDDEIVKRWGGKRALDRLLTKEMRGSPEN